MGNGFPFFDIILFAMIAAFLVLRLRGVLGRRDGHEGNGHEGNGSSDPFKAEREQNSKPSGANVIKLPDNPEQASGKAEEFAKAQTPLSAGLSQIAISDPSFRQDDMVAGSRIAFEMILGAFAKGDLETLENLLYPEVCDNFRRTIEDREKDGLEMDDTLIGIRSAEIVEAFMEDHTASVTVKFVSEQVMAVRDAEGNVVKGDPNRVLDVTDFWTFARDTNSSNPNWALLATNSLD